MGIQTRCPIAGVVLLISSAPAAAEQFRVLVFTRTAGYQHAAIPQAVEAVEQLAARHCFIAESTDDAAAFTPANLARFRVVMFLLTTGDVLDTQQEEAFEAWFRAGGGWVGVHSAADTEYNWPFYGEMLGAYFAGHPAPQSASIIVEDASHPSTAHLPAVWNRFDEWYNFQRNPRPHVQVLMRLDESTYSGGTMGDHPIAWFHEYQGGRAWYTGGGHTPASYSEPEFVQHLLGGILWAADDAGCACYANCDQSTVEPILNIDDFTCFINDFAGAQLLPHEDQLNHDANCDGSTTAPVLNVDDFTCFINAFAAGCP